MELVLRSTKSLLLKFVLAQGRGHFALKYEHIFDYTINSITSVRWIEARNPKDKDIRIELSSSRWDNLLN